MDSRLPKPSGLKRPAPPTSFRAMVPSDRLNTHHTSNATSALIAAGNSRAAITAQLKLPLAVSDVLNLPNQHTLAGHKRRLASPDPSYAGAPKAHHQPPPIVRAKIRRSRSASELRTRPAANVRLMATNNAHNRLISGVSASVDSAQPPKLSKSVTSLRLGLGTRAGDVNASSIVNHAAKPRVPLQQRLASRPNSAISSSSSGSGSTTTLKRTAAMTSKNVSASNASTSSTSAGTSSTAGNMPPKKFAPYDFKGRFLDLKERFKALQERYNQTNEEMIAYRSVGEQLEESQTSLFRMEEQLRNERSQTDCLRSQITTQGIKLESVAASLAQKEAELRIVRTEQDRLRVENEAMRPELVELQERSRAQAEQMQTLAEVLTETQESLFRSNMERKDLHNVVMDLRGNIRVFCRVRPPLAGIEEQRMSCGWQYLDESTLEISTVDAVNGGKKAARHEFSFDQVFHPRSSQADIFELVSPLIQSALDGYNVCIFAYGQTGSGKTFTMDGVPEDIGIIPRTVDLLFDCIRNYRRLGWEYGIKVTFLEIYNEVLYDLLSNDAKDMDIRMVSAKHPTEIYVSNITEITVDTADELRELMRLAKSNRATAATVGNERSSRSHAVTRIQLIGQHASKQETSVGNINLVDLAGSESPKTSIRMEETKKINKSLSELTNVIMALMQRQEHIPYRNSKLTHLLMPCLGGNSKTLMFINVAPFQDCFVESLKSLRFAASVNQCKVAKAKRNKYLNTCTDQQQTVRTATGSSASLPL